MLCFSFRPWLFQPVSQKDYLFPVFFRLHNCVWLRCTLPFTVTFCSFIISTSNGSDGGKKLSYMTFMLLTLEDFLETCL